ncbi:MAG: hypothetical protein AAGK93_06740 [Pseudomonadota bacterium]
MKTTDEFTAVLTRVSEGWETKNTDLALSAFSGDALYTEPPDRQIARSIAELANCGSFLTASRQARP